MSWFKKFTATLVALLLLTSVGCAQVSNDTRRPKLTFVAQTLDATDQTTIYTFTGASIGTAQTDRNVIVMVAMRSVGAPVISSITVGGNAIEISRVDNGSVRTQATGWINVPTGTTANIVINFSGATVTNAGLCVWTLTGWHSGSVSPAAVITDTTNISTATIAVPDGAVVTAMSHTAVNATAVWTGLTERSDAVAEAAVAYTCADLSPTAPNSALSITTTYTPSAANSRIHVATWR